MRQPLLPIVQSVRSICLRIALLFAHGPVGMQRAEAPAVLHHLQQAQKNHQHGDDGQDIGAGKAAATKAKAQTSGAPCPEIVGDAWAVDAACSGNPGPMEYRCVRIDDGTEVFHLGPLADGTNNIGEYLAIIHAAALLAQRGDTRTPIYSDSRTALAWVRNRGARTKLEHTARNARIFELLARADRWIQTHTIANPLLKWDTDNWGEIPADFGRKH